MTMRLGRSRSPMRTAVKRGWVDMTWLPTGGSNRDDDLADLLAGLDEAMGVGDLVEGEGSRDRGPQGPIGEPLGDEALQGRETGVVPHEAGQGEPAEGEVP